MSKVENAVRIAEAVAADDSIGYQWGGWGPEYDCGHLIIDAFERAGIPVKSRGASYTGNMPAVFMACGAANVTDQVNLDTGAGMKRGDVLVNLQNHAALYVGGGRIVQARSNFDGVPGDSSGQEIRVQGYYNYPWDCCLRFMGDSSEPDEPERELYAVVVQLPELRRGDTGYYVQEMQSQLILHDCSPRNTIRKDGTCDGEFGTGTEAALRKFQAMHKLPTNGVCDGQCWAELINK